MKSKLVLAGMVLASNAAMADAASSIPDICKSVANYAAQTLNMRFEDGTFTDKPLNPKSIKLKMDTKQFPITNITFLGNCDEDGAKLKDRWCRVAGGSPDVFQIEVSQKESDGTYPLADVVVTFNRGGCWVDEAALK